MNNKKIIAILPMRSGSQRIINKNTRLIKNKFLYEYIVDKILEIKMISKILINTDIKSVHEKYKNNNKIELIQRNEKLKGNCNINLVIAETITNIESDLFIQVHATNPLFNIATLESAINFYFENINKYDSLFSVTKIFKRFWYNSGNPVNFKINDEPTTQNLEPYLEENSCFFLFSKISFFKQNNRIGLNPKLFEISKEESCDVDEEADLSILAKLLNDKTKTNLKQGIQETFNYIKKRGDKIPPLILLFRLYFRIHK